jgi:hypothetical protein
MEKQTEKQTENKKLDLTKDMILLEKSNGDLKSFNSFKDLFIDFSKNNFQIIKLSDKEITIKPNDDKKEITLNYAILSHTDLKVNFEYEVNEHRIKLKDKLDSLKEDGVNISEEELKKLQEQFSFLPEDLIDN